jgi:hypothetical protein
MVGDAPCGFVPIDWLKDDVEASSDPVVSGITLTVEVQYFPSGRMPWALPHGPIAVGKRAIVSRATGPTVGTGVAA